MEGGHVAEPDERCRTIHELIEGYFVDNSRRAEPATRADDRPDPFIVKSTLKLPTPIVIRSGPPTDRA